MALSPAPPIPQRIPPLRWRSPSLLWTPIALALAIGWPIGLFSANEGLQRLTLAGGACIFAAALLALGVAWGLGRAPRTRRTVVMYIVWAGAAVSLAAPFVLTDLVAAVATPGVRETFTLSMSLTMIPLALVLGLPLALISGLIFAWTAFAPPRPRKAEELVIERPDVQPFQ